MDGRYYRQMISIHAGSVFSMESKSNGRDCAQLRSQSTCGWPQGFGIAGVEKVVRGIIQVSRPGR